MADIVSRIKTLEDKISRKKAEKALALEKIEEIKKELEKKKIDVTNLEILIEEKETEAAEIEEKITNQLRDAENVINNTVTSK